MEGVERARETSLSHFQCSFANLSFGNQVIGKDSLFGNLGKIDLLVLLPWLSFQPDPFFFQFSFVLAIDRKREIFLFAPTINSERTNRNRGNMLFFRLRNLLRTFTISFSNRTQAPEQWKDSTSPQSGENQNGTQDGLVWIEVVLLI